jgi:hypothetical protein
LSTRPNLNIHTFQATPTELVIRLPIVMDDEISEKERGGVAGGLCSPMLIKVGMAIATVVAQGLRARVHAGRRGVGDGLARALPRPHLPSGQARSASGFLCRRPACRLTNTEGHDVMRAVETSMSPECPGTTHLSPHLDVAARRSGLQLGKPGR